jgi:hypothetical protein
MRPSLIASVGILLLAAALHAAEPLPTLPDMQADFDAGKYPECLQKIAKVINLGGAAAANYDRYALWTLKGETLLQQKNVPDAADAFTGARKAAKERKDAALSGATAALIKKSDALQYTPKTGTDKTPIPVVDKTKRTAAITALFNDELAPVQARQKELLKSPALPPIATFAPTLDQLSLLELAATGADDQTKTMKKDLADHVTKSINAVLVKNAADVDKIKASANQTYDLRITNPTTKVITTERHKQGLMGNDRSVLDAIIATSDKLHPMCATLTDALGADFKADLVEADSIKKKAQDVENANYSGVVLR